MAGTNQPVSLGLSDFVKKLNANLNRVATDPDYLKQVTEERQGNPITLGPLVISPEEWAAKQVERASRAASEWEKNVQRPRRDPIKAAIAAGPKRAEKLRESLDNKKWEKAMASVDEDLMYSVIRKRGAAAFRSGIEDRKEKVLARAKELQPLVATLKATIDAMPDVTDADREKRLLAARRGMIEIGKKRRGI